MTRKGLFLDLDGTLCDSLGGLRAVWREFLLAHGAAFAEDDFEFVNGPPIPVVVKRLKERYGLAGAEDAFAAEYLERIKATHGDSPPMAGAEILLLQARARGWKVAVVTSNARIATEAWLARQGFAPSVDIVVGGDDVVRGKPDPEPYRLALARTGADPAGSVAVEDSVEGAQAALGAGLPLWLVDRRGLPATVGSPLFRGLIDGLAGICQYL